MRPCHYTEVLGALVRLGCAELHETETHIWICRWGSTIDAIPKDESVPIWIQFRLIEKFHFYEEDYVRVMERTN